MADTHSKGHGAGHPDEETTSDWHQVLEYIKENPRTVLAGVIFVVVCIAAGAIFSVHKKAVDLEVMTDYATALNEEDAGARASELQRIAEGNSRWSVEALYLAGESSIEAKVYDKAREAFNEVVSDHPDSDYAAPAAEGLAFLDENDGKLEEALAGYTKVFNTYSDTFIGRRQPFNIGRVHEALDQIPEAIEFYKRQAEVFPESIVAAQAEQALARLEGEHPDLFPEEEADDVAVDMDEHDHGAEGHVHSDSEAMPVETTPVEEAAAVEAPAEEAAPEAAEAPAEDAAEAPAEEAAPEAAEAPAEEAAPEAAEAPAEEAAPEATESPAEEAAPEAAEAPAEAAESAEGNS